MTRTRSISDGRAKITIVSLGGRSVGWDVLGKLVFPYRENTGQTIFPRERRDVTRTNDKGENGSLGSAEDGPPVNPGMAIPL